VLGIAKSGFPHMGGNIVAEFSLSSFYDNFQNGTIINEDLLALLKEQINKFDNSIQQ
jgi:hypothetical protein